MTKRIIAFDEIHDTAGGYHDCRGLYYLDGMAIGVFTCEADMNIDDFITAVEMQYPLFKRDRHIIEDVG